MSKENPCIIVNDRNEYFWVWCALLSPRYDGDDDSFTTVAGWTAHSDCAYIFSSFQSANKVLHRIISNKVAIIRYSECEPIDSQ